MGSFTLVRPHCAGIDLGSAAHYVAAARKDEEEVAVRSYGCFTQDLTQMALWLLDMGVTDVAMEATGVYWIPVYEALSSFGLKVALVDGRAAKALPGRKSDVQDCQWIRELHMHGLLKPCHVPDGQTLAIRSYWRQRQRLIEQRAEQIQLMHKAMEQMNVQLHKVLSDVSGVSGMAIMRAIVSGERDVFKLSEFVHKRAKASPQTIQAALEGSWADHHVFALAQALESYDFFGQKLEECDQRIDAKTAEISGGGPSGPPSTKPRKNQLTIDLHARVVELLGVDPTTIDGIQAQTAMTLICELGTDLSGFPTTKHFSSYMGHAPRNKITGGKIKSSRTAKVASRAATALRVAAQSLARSNTALGAKYRRLKARIGAPKATTAIARHIGIAYYNLVRYGIQFQDEGAQAYEERFRAQRTRWLQKQADKLGMALTPLPESAISTTFS
jgi:transposase